MAIKLEREQTKPILVPAVVRNGGSRLFESIRSAWMPRTDEGGFTVFRSTEAGTGASVVIQQAVRLEQPGADASVLAVAKKAQEYSLVKSLKSPRIP